MTRYTMPWAVALQHVPKNPERTARKEGSGMNFDVTFQVWPNRASMAKSIRMQQKREAHSTDWRPIVKLTDGEGY